VRAVRLAKDVGTCRSKGLQVEKSMVDGEFEIFGQGMLDCIVKRRGTK
jgi:hypothetical protein